MSILAAATGGGHNAIANTRFTIGARLPMAHRRHASRAMLYVLASLVFICGIISREQEATMTTIFEADHDGCTVMDTWDTVLDTGGQLSSNAASRLNGSVCGVEVEFNAAFGKNLFKTFTPPASNQYRLRFYFDPNGLTLSGVGTVDIMTVFVRNPSSPFQTVQVSYYHDNAGNRLLRAHKLVDSDVIQVQLFSGVAVSDEPHCVEIRVVRETTSSSNDGEIQIYMDGVELVSTTNVANFTAFSASTRYQVTWTDNTNPTGTMYGDEFILDNNADADLGCSAGPITDEWTAAAMKKPCAISMDGDYIYIAALDSLGQPTLIKFATDLTSDGSIVFQPGSGDNIGVQTARRDSNVVWIGGDFGAGDVLEKSEDGGASWTVKDPGTFDAVSSFNISPESDERVLIATNPGGSAAGGTLQLTLDDGATWQEVNPSTGIVIRDIAQLDKNPQETVFGGETPDELDYSINTGANLEDYSSGLPATDVTKLVIG